jgi:cardiolipin synthase C
LTTLEQWIEPRVAANGGRSGFRLLPNGLDAFVARAILIDLAERTLDLQYYLFHPDKTGSLVIDRLIAAADRGVWVRLLLDDWGTLEKDDAAVAVLDAHPNIEIRLFNPYVHRRGLGRLVELALRFARVNRRMHNKQLIADNAGVVLGGRNIGDEYFSLGELDFQDVDVLALGPIADQSTKSFEAYWNSEFAVPVDRISKITPDPAKSTAARQELGERCTQLADSPYGRALAGSGLATDLRAHSLHLHWADAKLIADPPDKLNQPPGTRSDRFLGGQISPYARAVRSNMLIVSPYFVPRKRSRADQLTRRDRRVAGPRRLPEVPPAPARAWRVNLDPRSLEQNTEVGVLVNSPELAAEVASLFDRWASPALAYEVTKGQNGRLEWTGGFTDEPGAGFWRPLGAKFFSLLPIDSLI